MKKILLKNGLEVAEVALGAMNFGTTTSKEDAYKILDLYVEQGGNFIDTSNNYAHWQGTGDESETVLGQWLRDRGGREDLVIATKVGFDRHGKGAGLKREQIEYWIDESLRKLGTDHIDLYYAHTDDPSTPMEETMEAFDSLVRKGKVRHLGNSNFDTWRLAEANVMAESRGLTPYTAMQQCFTYLQPNFNIPPKYKFNEMVNRERLRYLCDKDMPLVAYSCLCKGGYDVPERLPEIYGDGGERFALIRKMAAEKGVNPSAIVVSWLVNAHRLEGYPRIIPLFAASANHFADNLRGLDIVLSDEELAIMEKTK